MTQPYALAFVGENANGILRWWTEKILSGFARRGLSSTLIDLRDPGWRAHLADRLVHGKPEFCFSFQGFGMDLKLNGVNYWSLNEIPFLSYLGDNPYHAPSLHAAEGSGLYLLYNCADFLETYQRCLNGRTYSTLLRYGFPKNPYADLVPWRQREHDIVFVKTGIDPAALRAEWNDMPRVVRGLLHDGAARVLSGADRTVADLCAEAFAERQVHWGERRELFLFVCSTVDRYARAVRAERMARALLARDALIIGDWRHLEQSNARCRFMPSIAAQDLDGLYARTKIQVNTSPTIRFGMHERIMAGLFAKAAVVSDTTPFLQRTLKDCPSFMGVDIDRASFAEELHGTLDACLADPATADKVQRSAAVAQELFSFDDFIQALLDYVDLERHRRALSGWWAFPPASHQPTHSTAA